MQSAHICAFCNPDSSQGFSQQFRKQKRPAIHVLGSAEGRECLGAHAPLCSQAWRRQIPEVMEENRVPKTCRKGRPKPIVAGEPGPRLTSDGCMVMEPASALPLPPSRLACANFTRWPPPHPRSSFRPVQPARPPLHKGCSDPGLQ